ncbi:uncharacterized protein LOC125546032 isoform X3 [Triticum urartu]|uniref:uncharacterized protein LOC125546032 isoform X3 n=1 Tax=Triticum urartu TaxID=4572 RepID=UPI002044AAF3|nr:uncharacterized protein LOC125546032 isoform X3 [Triticum urartu]
MVSSWTHDGTSALPKRVVHHLTPKDAVEHHLQQLVVAAAATVLLARGLHERLLEEQPLRQVASGWTWWPGCASMDDDSLRATLTILLLLLQYVVGLHPSCQARDLIVDLLFSGMGSWHRRCSIGEESARTRSLSTAMLPKEYWSSPTAS